MFNLLLYYNCKEIKMMKKLITILAVLFAMFALSANPKVTILDVGCGNTTEYVNKILANNDLIKSDTPMTDKTSKYVNMFKQGTFLIENEDEAALVSIYNGRPIYGSSVLANCGKKAEGK